MSCFDGDFAVPLDAWDDLEAREASEDSDMIVPLVLFDEVFDNGLNALRSLGVGLFLLRSGMLLELDGRISALISDQGKGSGFLPTAVAGVHPADSGVGPADSEALQNHRSSVGDNPLDDKGVIPSSGSALVKQRLYMSSLVLKVLVG